MKKGHCRQQRLPSDNVVYVVHPSSWGSRADGRVALSLRGIVRRCRRLAAERLATSHRAAAIPPMATVGHGHRLAPFRRRLPPSGQAHERTRCASDGAMNSRRPRRGRSPGSHRQSRRAALERRG
ncbi:unnamed protein product [Lampetra fluviatilis]